jgi:hypothetical protein
MKKNVTIDDLAVMVSKGFSGVDKRFESMDKRFDLVDKRFESMDKRFESMDKRFDKIENLILENHKRRIEKLEAETKDLKELFAI